MEDMDLISGLFGGVLSAVILLLVGEPAYRLIFDWKLRRDFKLRDRANVATKNNR